MAIQLSVAVRNGMLDAFETAIGTGPVLKIRTGTALATLTLTSWAWNTNYRRSELFGGVRYGDIA